MPTEPMIRVVLTDDNLIFREGMHALLSVWGDVDVVGGAGDYDELLAVAAEHVPQVVVAERIEPSLVKGRQTPVGAYRMGSASA